MIPARGYDHWFRLFLPRETGVTSFDVPRKANLIGYVRFRRMPTEVRPHQVPKRQITFVGYWRLGKEQD